MEKNMQYNSHNAFIQVKHEIKHLMDFDGEDDLDDVIYTANKLTYVLRTVNDNYQSWNDEDIKEFVLSKNDPLRNLDFKSDKFNHLVRKIQQHIIVQFS